MQSLTDIVTFFSRLKVSSTDATVGLQPRNIREGEALNGIISHYDVVERSKVNDFKSEKQIFVIS